MYRDDPGTTVKIKVEKVRGGERRAVHDVVAAEEPMEIRLAQGDEPPISVSITMRTPGNDFELAAGFLFTEGIVRAGGEIEGIDYAPDASPERQYNVVQVTLRPGQPLDVSRLSRNFYVTSSCGVCGKASLDALAVQGCAPVASHGFVVAERALSALPAVLRQQQRLFEETGGLHAAGLFAGDGELLLLREDVGRHNAVDKVIGAALLADSLPLSERILVLSGRASFELLQKAVVAGLPVVAAVGAPSSLAVDAARDFGVTLVGFLRPDGFNIYTGAERILLGE